MNAERSIVEEPRLDGMVFNPFAARHLGGILGETPDRSEHLSYGLKRFAG